jgi:dTDP-4-dehydrorhamnose 3,5-epimerase
MKAVETAIPDVKVLEPTVFRDERGFFLETWNAKTFGRLGLDMPFVQDNHSRSAKGVLRGLHFQTRRPQGKLTRVIAGAAFDVAVDLRRNSRSFGKWVGVVLSAENKRQVWIPPGFAHGFLCLEDNTEVTYKCTDFYDPGYERTLLWNDPPLGIAWPLEITGAPKLSAKDTAGLTIDALEEVA